MPDRDLLVMMKPTGDGELTPLVCYADGEPLPGQQRVVINTACDEIATVTVTLCMLKFA